VFNAKETMVGKVTIMDMAGSEKVNVIQQDYFTYESKKVLVFPEGFKPPKSSTDFFDGAKSLWITTLGKPNDAPKFESYKYLLSRRKIDQNAPVIKTKVTSTISPQPWENLFRSFYAIGSASTYSIVELLLVHNSAFVYAEILGYGKQYYTFCNTLSTSFGEQHDWFSTDLREAVKMRHSIKFPENAVETYRQSAFANISPGNYSARLIDVTTMLTKQDIFTKLSYSFEGIVRKYSSLSR